MLLTGGGSGTSRDWGVARWTGLDPANVIEPALFKLNMSIDIGTTIVVGDASLVLVQTAAPDERETEVACRSDLS